MKNYFYPLYLAFILWATSSTIVVNFKGLFPPFQAASVVTILATIFVTILFLIIDKKVIVNLFNCRADQLLLLSLIGFCGLFLYPIFYFFGLHSEWPLEANVINYCWPMIGAFFGFIFKVEKATFKKLISVALGLLDEFEVFPG